MVDVDEDLEYKLLRILLSQRGYEICASYSDERFFKFMVRKQRR